MYQVPKWPRSCSLGRPESEQGCWLGVTQELIHELGIGAILLSVKSDGVGGCLLGLCPVEDSTGFPRENGGKEVLLKIIDLACMCVTGHVSKEMSESAASSEYGLVERCPESKVEEWLCKYQWKGCRAVQGG